MAKLKRQERDQGAGGGLKGLSLSLRQQDIYGAIKTEIIWTNTINTPVRKRNRHRSSNRWQAYDRIQIIDWDPHNR